MNIPRTQMRFLERAVKIYGNKTAVIGKQDPKWGEIPMAIVVPKPEASLTPEDIVAFTRKHLAHFKALREAEVVEVLPRGGKGKILKSELRKKYGLV